MFWLETNAEIYSTEIMKLCGDLEAILSSPMAGLALQIHIYTDSLNIVREIKSILNGSSHVAFIRSREGVKR